MYIKTLIIDSCYPKTLNNLPIDLENLILPKIYVNSDNYSINNLPITLKTLIVCDVIGSTESTKLFFENIKLPFCCKLIYGIKHYLPNNKNVFSFKYINNYENFLFDTYWTEYNLINQYQICTIHYNDIDSDYYFYLN